MLSGEYKVVPIDNLRPNDWNPNAQSSFIFKKEKKSIQQFGFVDPVTVRKVGKKSWEIIDGEHRWKAASELGFDNIPIIDLGEMSDNDAKALTLLLNELRGEADPLALAGIVVELIDADSIYEDAFHTFQRKLQPFVKV